MQVVLEAFKPGRRIYIPGASGESTALAEALAADPARLRGVNLVSCLLPGINNTDYAALHPESRLTVFLPGPFLRASFAAGQLEVPAMSYAGIAAGFDKGPMFDVAVAQVAPPDPDSSCSLGIAADFSGIAWRNARRRVAIINPAMPRTKRSPRIFLDEADIVVTADAPLLCAGPFRTTPQLTAIAEHVVNLVPDGAAIQLGIGGAPAVVWRHLTSHRNLTISSGIVVDDLSRLVESGALQAGKAHLTGIAYGTMAFYRYLAESDLVAFGSTLETHNFVRLAALPRFTSINAAIEVDLFGQVNSEWRGGQLISGVGGGPDFMRGAAASAGGRSIITLPATAKGAAGTVSKIVPKLESHTVSIARSDVDTIITEYGVAELKGRSLGARAEALIEIAAPEYRDELVAAWRAMRRGF
jgi:acyl-CoA hydrolase